MRYFILLIASLFISQAKAEPIPPIPLLAWEAFCKELPHECSPDLNEPDRINLTPEFFLVLQEVNDKVNRDIKPLKDMDHWGLEDKWNYPDDGLGDCEDIQLLKRRTLVEKGYPRRAMRMAVVINSLGEGHAVLMIRTNAADFIMDNQTNSILPRGRTGYVYNKYEDEYGKWTYFPIPSM